MEIKGSDECFFYLFVNHWSKIHNIYIYIYIAASEEIDIAIFMMQLPTP